MRSQDTIRKGELIRGHTPAYWAALARPCPKCGAQPQKKCQTPSGGGVQTHAARFAEQS